MKRRDFIALSTAPIATAAGVSIEPTAPAEGHDAMPPDAEIIAAATKIKIELFRGRRNLIGEFEISGSFGIDNEFDADDASNEPAEAISLPLMQKLITAFINSPTTTR